MWPSGHLSGTKEASYLSLAPSLVLCLAGSDRSDRWMSGLTVSHFPPMTAALTEQLEGQQSSHPKSIESLGRIGWPHKRQAYSFFAEGSHSIIFSPPYSTAHIILHKPTCRSKLATAISPKLLGAKVQDLEGLKIGG